MPESHSIAPAKPSKPYPVVPPLPARDEALGLENPWGVTHYFGPWSDSDSAPAKSLEWKDALHVGRAVRPNPFGVTVKTSRTPS
jgi:hypothetical protein